MQTGSNRDNRRNAGNNVSPWSSARDEEAVRQRIARMEKTIAIARAKKGRAEEKEEPAGSRMYASYDGSVYAYHLREDDTVCIDLCEPGCERLLIPTYIDGRTVTAFGTAAFSGLSGVKEIVCPPHVTRMAGRIFDSCRDLEFLELPEDLSKFDSFWVRGCTNLDTLYLPGSIEAIKSNIFGIHCPRTVRLGRMTSKVESSAFMGSKIERIEVDPENKFFSTDGRSLFSRDGTVFATCVSNNAIIEVPDHCTTIGYKAFAYTKNLREVVLPDSITKIDGYAFLGSSVERVRMSPNVTSIGEKAFYECRNLGSLVLGDELVEIGPEAFAHSKIGSLKIPMNVKSIGKGAFSSTPMMGETCNEGLYMDERCRYTVDEYGGVYEKVGQFFDFIEMLSPGIREYSLLPGTKRILPNAFFRHSRIESVELPEGLEDIGAYAFKGCNNLKSINWPDSLVSIGDEAFMDTDIREFHVSASFRKLGKVPFMVHSGRKHESVSMLAKVDVDPDNPCFFIKNGLLCRSTFDGGIAYMYVGPDKDVRIPEEVMFVAPYALCGYFGINSVTLHRYVYDTGFKSLMVDGSIRKITLEGGGPSGEDVTVEFPDMSDSLKIQTLSYMGGRPSIELLYSYADSLVYWVGDTFERARLAIERLDNPICMHDGNRIRLRSIFEHNLVDVCLAFSDRLYTSGLEKMADLGFINADNINEVIEAVTEKGNTQVTGLLLEMKRRRFGGSKLDLYI